MTEKITLTDETKERIAQIDKLLAGADIVMGFTLYLEKSGKLMFTQSPGLKTFGDFERLVKYQRRVLAGLSEGSLRGYEEITGRKPDDAQ